MELSEFISATLSEIQKGVQLAINGTIASGVNGAINPVWGTPKDIGSAHIQNVHFDIAVTVWRRFPARSGVELRSSASVSEAAERARASRRR
jgi:hypothetical protein